jgi:hypothetical protein
MMDYTTVRLFEALPDLVTLNNANKKLKTISTILIVGAASVLAVKLIDMYVEYLKKQENENRTN